MSARGKPVMSLVLVPGGPGDRVEKEDSPVVDLVARTLQATWRAARLSASPPPSRQAQLGLQLLQHGLLALADLDGPEAHEPALLGRLGSGLRGGEQPGAVRAVLLGGRPRPDELTGRLELGQHLCTGSGALLDLEVLQRVLPALRHGLQVQ